MEEQTNLPTSEEHKKRVAELHAELVAAAEGDDPAKFASVFTELDEAVGPHNDSAKFAAAPHALFSAAVKAITAAVKENTAAVKENTAAVKENTAAVKGAGENQ